VLASTVVASTALAVPASALTAPLLHGLDISAYQHQQHGRINWTRVRSSSIRFAAIKAAEGSYYVNPYYAADARAAVRAGLLVAPYTFANPHASGGARQARYVVDRSGYRWVGRMLPLEVDLEPDPYVRREHVNICYGLDRSQMVSWVEAFVGQARSLTGARPLIYTTASWWRKCTGDSSALRIDPLWVAAYGTSQPQMPGAWPNWTFWQYKSSGRVAGIGYRGGIDLDYGSRSVLSLLRPQYHRHPSGHSSRQPSRHRARARARN
jgi:GH25 family lysozyme M1 (1,4-beta-N-acetylmuramidase)